MLLFSQKMISEGMSILQSHFLSPEEINNPQFNWKFLKGLELSGSYDQCLQLAEKLCKKSKSENAILHPLALDAIISSHCHFHNFKQVMVYSELMRQRGIRMELSTLENIVNLLLTNQIWKNVYEDMNEKAREQNIELTTE